MNSKGQAVHQDHFKIEYRKMTAGKLYTKKSEIYKTKKEFQDYLSDRGNGDKRL